MKLNKISISTLLLGMALTGCSDFLDKEPLDQGTDAIMYKTPAQFDQAALALYSSFTDKDCGHTSWNNADYDGNLDVSGIGGNGGASAPQNTNNWKKPYERLRNINILLEKAEGFGDKDAIASSIGTAYFFRAWEHFYLVRKFGGVPIVDHVLDTNDPALYAARNSRYEVMSLVFSDLQKAVELLPKRSALPGLENRGRITREGAQAFLARVALYEGTWEKYVPTIGFDLDGDGSGNGAGSVKPEGYPSVNDMLKMAQDMSKAVIQEDQTGTFALFNACDELSYYSLFNLDDGDGNVSNHLGIGKVANKEFVICNPYDYTLKRSGVNNAHKVATWQAVNISAYLGESYVCSNGLPIYLSTSGSIDDAYYNPDFGGYDTYMGEFQNRDMRFISTTYLPDRPVFCCDGEHWVPRTAAGEKYPEAVFPAATDHYDAADPANSSKLVVYNPMIDLNSTHNGYGSRKFMPEGSGRADNTDAADYPILRLAEVHCIYAEAVCELGNGAISDDDLNFSINKNRERARVAPLTNALIANVYDANWFNFATGKHEVHKMTMLDEIRRERMVELHGEGFRLDDLKRWGIAHINLTGQKLGRKILGTYYGNPANKVNSLKYSGTPVYDPQSRPTQWGLVSEDTSDIDYGRPIATIPGNCLFSAKDYLDPLPLEQIRLNPNLKQNPGW